MSSPTITMFGIKKYPISRLAQYNDAASLLSPARDCLLFKFSMNKHTYHYDTIFPCQISNFTVAPFGIEVKLSYGLKLERLGLRRSSIGRLFSQDFHLGLLGRFSDKPDT